jgi:hypothetical protein
MKPCSMTPCQVGYNSCERHTRCWKRRLGFHAAEYFELQQIKWHVTRWSINITHSRDNKQAGQRTGTCCISGCTLTIIFGLYSWKAQANLLPTMAV